MARKGWGLAIACATLLAATAAWAGAGGAPPGGGEGGSGPEPEVFALILFSLAPGIFFIRRALAARGEVEET